MSNPLDLTPVEFEIFVRQTLEKQGGCLKEFSTQHLEILHGLDGDYEIDVTARFEALGVDFLALIECKRYTSKPVEREQIQALNQKLLSVGAQKAIVFCTSSFRSGAIAFARTHGIALAIVKENELTYATKSFMNRFKTDLVDTTTKSLSTYLFDGREQAESGDTLSEKERLQVLKIAILERRLDYLRIIASRAYDISSEEIDALRANIMEEKQLLKELGKQLDTYQQ